MKRKINIIGLTLFFALTLFSLAFSEESMTITTYYPSPYGSYNELTTTGNTYLATTSGRVGIGTAGPRAKFSVAGSNDDELNLYSYADNQLAIQTTLDGQPLGTYGGDNNQLLLQPLVGRVGIGTASPGAKLDVNGNIYDSGGSLIFSTTTGTHTGIGNTAGWAAIENAANYNTLMILGRSGGIGGGRSVSIWDRLDVNGQAYCSSGAWSGSDIRWKKNIESLPNDTLDRVLKLRGVKFEWRREDFKDKSFREGKQIGIIAQEIEKQFPELISTDADGYKSFAYDKFTAVLLEAIKAQQQQIEALRVEIANLEKKL